MLYKNHMDFLLVVLPICQAWDILSGVLDWDVNEEFKTELYQRKKNVYQEK